MYLRDFAEQRGQKADTVAAYIRDHAAEFDGHTSIIDRQKWLDEVAIELLDKKYPLPKPVQIVQNEERIRELEAQLYAKAEEINGYLKELREADQFKYMISAAKTEVAKLEADIDRRDELLDKKEQELSKEKQAHQNTASELADTQKQLVDTQQELERLKNRSLWQRIFNK